MRTWQLELLDRVAECGSASDIFQCIERSAKLTGFDYCAYGLRTPFPLSAPRTVTMSTYPQEWQHRYKAQGYIQKDPTVAHGSQSEVPVVWSDSVFASEPQMWHEAQDSGLKHGWAQSSLDSTGTGGMLTLARSATPISDAERAAMEIHWRWLVAASHFALARLIRPTLHERVDLTQREVEVLRWTADGKTSSEISTLLAISENTVNFHVKNVVLKMQVANKTAAVVRAALLGLLN